MKIKTFIIIILASFAVFTSCKKAPLTIGETTMEVRELDAFDSLIIYDDINVVLVRSDNYKIELTAGENIISNITSEVKNGILTLTNDNLLGFIRTYNYSIDAKLYFKDLHYIMHSSCGTLKTENQLNDSCNGRKHEIVVDNAAGDADIEISHCDSLKIDYIYGTSMIKLRGNCNNFITIHKKSFGRIDAIDYDAKHVRIWNKSVGDCSINASEYIYSNIQNIGNIYYKGDPTEIVEEYGEDARGKLIRYVGD